MTQHERPTVLSSEPKDLLPGGNLRWLVAGALLGVIAVASAAAYAWA